MDTPTVATLSFGSLLLGAIIGLVLGVAQQDEPLRRVESIPGLATVAPLRSDVERDDIGPITVDKAPLLAEKMARRAYVMRLYRAGLEDEAARWMRWMER
jgi:hypothetical protein